MATIHPAAGIGIGRRATRVVCRWSGQQQHAGWGFQLLPYLEEESTWQAGAETAIAAALPAFFCPTRRGPQQVAIADHYDPPIHGGELLHGLCDYAASNRDNTGVIRRYQPLIVARVVDGTSKTLLFADKRLNLSLLGQPQDDDNEGYTAGWNSDTMRDTSRAPLPDYVGSGDGDKRFGSSHPGGVNTVRLDGSVHPISYDIDGEVFARLGGVDDA